MWALISTTSMSILDPHRTELNPVATITVPANYVVNIISYNGTDTYTPPTNTKLQNIASTYKIGDAL